MKVGGKPAKPSQLHISCTTTVDYLYTQFASLVCTGAITDRPKASELRATAPGCRRSQDTDGVTLTAPRLAKTLRPLTVCEETQSGRTVNVEPPSPGLTVNGSCVWRRRCQPGHLSLRAGRAGRAPCTVHGIPSAVCRELRSARHVPSNGCIASWARLYKQASRNEQYIRETTRLGACSQPFTCTEKHTICAVYPTTYHALKLSTSPSPFARSGGTGVATDRFGWPQLGVEDGLRRLPVVSAAVRVGAVGQVGPRRRGRVYHADVVIILLLGPPLGNDHLRAEVWRTQKRRVRRAETDSSASETPESRRQSIQTDTPSPTPPPRTGQSEVGLRTDTRKHTQAGARSCTSTVISRAYNYKLFKYCYKYTGTLALT